jgi:hypothetical protein
VKYLADKKLKLLAERNGWSLTRANGFLDGETFRRRGAMPSPYVQIGTDDYCVGFRAGYYERGGAQQVRTQDPAARASGNLSDTPKGAQEG